MADAIEPTLFDVATITDVDVPVCRMCDRPAWLRRDGQFSVYCGASVCTNRDRRCKVCGGAFHVNVDGAGTKYCSVECKRAGYQPLSGQSPDCAWCGKTGPKGTLGGSRSSGWPYICADCSDPIKHLLKALRSHHVPHGRARQLLDDPGCEICHRDIVTKIRDPNTGRIRSLLVVDHDHACCPGATSCGLCIRGLLCTQCNCAAGLLGDDAERARALAGYVERWSDAS